MKGFASIIVWVCKQSESPVYWRVVGVAFKIFLTLPLVIPTDNATDGATRDEELARDLVGRQSGFAITECLSASYEVIIAVFVQFKA